MSDGSAGKTAVTRGEGGSSSSPGRVPADEVKRAIAFDDQGLGSSSPTAASAAATTAAAAAGQAAAWYDVGMQGVGAVGDEMQGSLGSLASAATAAEAQQAAGGSSEDAVLEALAEDWEVRLRQSDIVKQQEQLRQEMAQGNKEPIAVTVSAISQHHQLPEVLFIKYGSIMDFIATRPNLHYVAAAKPYIEVL